MQATTHPPRPPAAYPEGLYRAAETARPLAGLGAVDDAAVEAFHAAGYLAVEGAFSAERVAAGQAAIEELIAGRQPGFQRIELEPPGGSPGEAGPDRVRKLSDFTGFDRRLRGFLHDPAMRAAIERLGVPDPVCFQEMALLKPPGGGREKPWHQDLAYFDYAHTTPVVGVWIALDGAVVANGCMHVIAGTHREPVPHHAIRDWQVCDTHVLGRPVVAAPLRPGGLLFFSGLLVHGTPENRSELRRRALQFHFAPSAAGKEHPDVRCGVFGEMGRAAEC